MRLGAWLLVSLTALGCARHPLVDRQIASAYAEAAALDTLHDYEVAELAAAAQLSRLEGLIAEERNDPELLALATRAWCRYAFFFAWEQHEAARERGDAGLALYHAERALGGFERASHYARELLGYPRDDARELTTHLATFDEHEQAPLLMWAGCAELGRAYLEPDPSSAGRAQAAARGLLDRAQALDAALGDGTGELLRGLLEALGGADPSAVGRHFERARQQSGGKLLFAGVMKALYVDCRRHDEAAFVRTLDAVARAGDMSPERRLDNLVARRRARRYLASPTLRARCGR